MENKTKKLWFKRKVYGWGWTPCSIEGWLVTVAYIILIIDIFKNVAEIERAGGDVFFSVFPKFLIVTLALLFICYRKGEKPHWSWGKK